jgi:hypothetical protein
MSGLTFGNAKFVSVCVVILFALVAIQPCYATPWSGSNSYFSWENGGSTEGLFGPPPLDTTGIPLIFSPSNFETSSLDGEELDPEFNSTTDTLEFELSACPGYTFQTIEVEESGSNYLIGDSSNACVLGLLSVKNLITNMTLPNQLISLTLDSSSSSDWQGSAQLSIPAGWTHIKITFQNTLSTTTAEEGDIAFITNTDSRFHIQTIPEPATIAIIGIGVLSLIRRKK